MPHTLHLFLPVFVLLTLFLLSKFVNLRGSTSPTLNQYDEYRVKKYFKIYDFLIRIGTLGFTYPIARIFQSMLQGYFQAQHSNSQIIIYPDGLWIWLLPAIFTSMYLVLFLCSLIFKILLRENYKAFEWHANNYMGYDLSPLGSKLFVFIFIAFGAYCAIAMNYYFVTKNDSITYSPLFNFAAKEVSLNDITKVVECRDLQSSAKKFKSHELRVKFKNGDEMSFGAGMNERYRGNFNEIKKYFADRNIFTFEQIGCGEKDTVESIGDS